MLLNLISKFRNCYLAHYFKHQIMIQLLINNLFHLFSAKEIEFALTKMVAQIEMILQMKFQFCRCEWCFMVVSDFMKLYKTV
jgi:hypoxanthine phosphoribosyltransferase